MPLNTDRQLFFSLPYFSFRTQYFRVFHLSSLMRVGTSKTDMQLQSITTKTGNIIIIYLH